MSKFIKIKPSDTTIDPRFQRELDEPRARAMARDYRPELVGVPVISRRTNGQMIRIDGQHRMAAAGMAGHGDTAILMEVHDGLSLQEEAELFLRLNGGRSAVRVYDKFKARQVAQEPVALAIVATLRGLGLKITKARQKRGVCAIQAVEYVYHRGNLEPTLRILTAWSDGDPETYEGPLVKAVSSFLIEYPQVDLIDVANRLQSYAPSKVIAQLRRTIGGFECKPHEAACMVLRDIYNARRKKNQLPPPSHKKDEKKAA